jgi:hypothetical protein
MKNDRNEIFEIFLVLLRRYPGVPVDKLTGDAWTAWATFDHALSEYDGSQDDKRPENRKGDIIPFSEWVEVKP